MPGPASSKIRTSSGAPSARRQAFRHWTWFCATKPTYLPIGNVLGGSAMSNGCGTAAERSLPTLEIRNLNAVITSFYFLSTVQKSQKETGNGPIFKLLGANLLLAPTTIYPVLTHRHYYLLCIYILIFHIMAIATF